MHLIIKKYNKADSILNMIFFLHLGSTYDDNDVGISLLGENTKKVTVCHNSILTKAPIAIEKLRKSGAMTTSINVMHLKKIIKCTAFTIKQKKQ